MSNEIYHFFHSLWSVWAMGLFLGIVLWAYWPRNKTKFEAYARIPLNDGDEER